MRKTRPSHCTKVAALAALLCLSRAYADVGGRRFLREQTSAHQSVSTKTDNGDEMKQTANAQVNGSNGATISTKTKMNMDEEGQLKGEALSDISSFEGEGKVTSDTKAYGFVKLEGRPYIINSAGGSSVAVGNDIAGHNSAWGATVDGGASGPDGTAGHDVSTDGDMTASTGHQIVKASEHNAQAEQSTAP